MSRDRVEHQGYLVARRCGVGHKSRTRRTVANRQPPTVTVSSWPDQMLA